MKKQLSQPENEEILKALDEALEKGPWEKSNFLRVIGKSLREIRKKFATQVNSPETNTVASLANQTALRSGQLEVFIGLYSFEGGVMQSWEKILTNLPKQVISRPIYAEEKGAMDLIRSKVNKLNEAYVSIFIEQGDIIHTPPDKTPVDKLGKSLLTLKDKALKLENINRFIHTSGIYKYYNGRLVKIAAVDE